MIHNHFYTKNFPLRGFRGLLMLAFIGLSLAASAQTIRYVKPAATGTGDGSSWANASGNIQTMINASASGNQVWIAGGNYLLTATLTMKQGVNVYGGFMGFETAINQRYQIDLDTNGTIEPWEFANATVLNGNNARRVLNQSSSFTVETVWDGVTITRGYTDQEGGGAYIRANAKLVNCTVSSNKLTTGYTTSSSGGGIYNNGGAITNCTVSGNTADSYDTSVSPFSSSYGGGIYNNGGTITNCTVSGNTASASVGTSSSYYDASSYGGGIYNNGGTITNCTVSTNTASASASNTSSSCKSYGGGIYNDAGGTISNSTIRGNKTSYSSTSSFFLSYGGGIYCANVTTSIVQDCVVENNNTGSSGTRCGGGIYQGNVSRCIIKGNSSVDGGGLYGSIARNSLIAKNTASASGGGSCATDNNSFVNCTFAENTATTRGGGIYTSNSTVTATNCVFWQNRASTGAQINGSVVVIYSAVQSGYAGMGNINLVAQNDEIGGPKFIDPANGEYQLQTGSPCINAGISSAVLTDVIDLAGNPRISNGIVDMGAYEWQGMLSPVITTTTLSAGTTGVAYSQTLAVTGTAPITWALSNGSLPAGLNLSAAGVISGTPTAAGAYNFTVQASNDAGNDTKSLAISITAPPAITTATLPNGVTGIEYNQAVTATGTTPINWSLASGNLPTGLNLSAAGVISGVPTAAGAFNFTVQATNSVGNNTKALTITVAAPPAITTTSLTNGTAGAAYSQTLTATGTAPIAWSTASVNLPTGLTLSEAGVISGTPTAAGTFNFTVQASNSAGNDIKTLSITIVASPVITTTILPAGTTGATYSQTLLATGTAPIIWTFVNGNLPTGLSLSAEGLISGVPSSTGTYNFTVLATNNTGSDTKALSITIENATTPPVITTIILPAGITGATYSQTLTATGTAPITWTHEGGNLPTGLTLSATGTISGTPTTAGAYNFTVQATNVAGSVTKGLSIIVETLAVPPVITTTTLLAGTVGATYAQTFSVTGTAPITWAREDGNLPTGLTLSADGAISGTPTEAGVFNFTVRATNSAGSNSKALSISVLALPVITTTMLPNGSVGTSYSHTLAATGSTPITWTHEGGNLPTGLTLSATGVISGTPTATGAFSFTVRADNSAGSDTKILSVTIAILPAITTTSLPDGTVGAVYGQSLTAAGTTPITWSVVSGNLPTGLTLSTGGVISGTPTVSGIFSFAVQASNIVGSDTKTNCSISIIQPVTGVTLNTSALTLATGGSEQLTATVAPANATNKSVAWSSSDDAIATVDNNGTVSAKAAGTATITVSTLNGNYTANCTVTVFEITVCPSPIASGTAGSLTWTLCEDRTLNISGVGNMPNYGYYDSPWYSWRSSIHHVVVDYGVSHIGNYAFQGCSDMISASIPNSVTTIGFGIFQNCSSLTFVTIPNSITNISAGAFAECSSLTSITIPGSVSVIQYYAFRNCNSLTSIVIPNSVFTIEHGVFLGCSKLTDVTLPASLANIGVEAFSGCNKLTAIVNQATTPQTIDASVFTGVDKENCVLYVPASSIGDYSNTDVWEDFLKVETIGSNIPVSDVSLNKAEAILRIGGTEQLTASVSPSIATNQTVTWNSSNDAIATVSNGGTVTAHAIGTATITVTTQDGNKTASCTITVTETGVCPSLIAGGSAGTLTWVLCPDGTLTISGNGEIPDYDWYGQPWYPYQNSITAVVIEHGVSRIGNIAFSYSGMSTVTIPNSVTSIGECAFYSCGNLISVSIPSSVKSIGTFAFYACNNFSFFDVDEYSMDYASEDGVLFNKTKTVLLQYPTKKADKNYVIPNSVMSIKQDALNSCREITSVTIPLTVTSIEGWAFSNCTGLTEIINYANTPQPIDDGVFNGVNKSAVTLYVPAASVDAYSDAAVWKEFLNMEALPAAVNDVSLNKTSATLEVGKTEQLTATVEPAYATNKNITWRSNNESVATVSGNGLVTAVSTGTATITVTTEDGGKTATCSITVNAPTPVITITTHPAVNTTVTQGSISGSLSVAASATPSAALSYQWYSNTTNSNTGGTVVSGATGASFTIPASLTAGTYYYFCEAMATGATSVRSNVATVTVNAPAIPVITITAQPAAVTTVTQGSITGSLSVAASVTPDAALSYQWYYNIMNSNTGGTVESGATGASFAIPATLVAGTYYYYCEVKATGATTVRTNVARVTVSASTSVITITAQPAANTTVTQGGITGSLLVMASVNPSATPAYQWYSNTSSSNVGGTMVSGATGASFTIPATLTAGTYYYFCEVSATGATSVRSGVATVTVNAAIPLITITTPPAVITTFTQGNITGSLTVAASATPSAALSYQWYSNTSSSNVGGAVVSGATDASFTIPATLTAGTYYYFCEVRAANATPVRSSVATVTVTIPQVLVTGVTLNKTALTLAVGGAEQLTATVSPSNAANKGVSWMSSDPSKAFVSDNGTVTATAAGVAVIVVTTQDGGKSATCTVTVSPLTSVETPDAPLARVYPNPTDGMITLEFEAEGNYMVTLADINGKALLHESLTGQTAQIDISSYPAGVYLLTIDDGKRQNTTRVVKN